MSLTSPIPIPLIRDLESGDPVRRACTSCMIPASLPPGSTTMAELDARLRQFLAPSSDSFQGDPPESYAVQLQASVRFRRWRKDSRSDLAVYLQGRRPLNNPAWSNKHRYIHSKLAGAAKREAQAGNDNDETDTSFHTPRLREPYQSLMSPLPKSGIREDPFQSLPISADGCVPLTIDYCA